MKKKITFLLLGDTLAIGLITVIGFLSHETLLTAPLMRLAATFFPTLLAWLLIAPWLGLYRSGIYSNFRQLWRAGWAGILAAPLAGLFRSLMLGGVPILPVFVLVLAATSAFGMIIWRGIWWFFTRARK